MNGTLKSSQEQLPWDARTFHINELHDEQREERFSMAKLIKWCCRGGRSIRWSVIFTFTLNAHHLQETCPELFEKPMLLLHGDDSAKMQPGRSRGTHIIYKDSPEMWRGRKRAVSRRMWETSELGPEVRVSQVPIAQGVFHPKMAFLALADGRLVVVVSSANFVKQVAIDGSWVQLFPPAYRTDSNTMFNSWRADDSPPNDFGKCLHDFMDGITTELCKFREKDRKLEEGWRHRMWCSPKSFLQSVEPNCKDCNLQDIYDFSGAHVRLVTTMPGKYDLDRGVLPAMGHMRVRQILMQEKIRDRSPASPDKVWLSQTSIGAQVDLSLVDQVCQSLLSGDENRSIDVEPHELGHIVWPTEKCIYEIRESLHKSHSMADRRTIAGIRLGEGDSESDADNGSDEEGKVSAAACVESKLQVKSLGHSVYFWSTCGGFEHPLDMLCRFMQYVHSSSQLTQTGKLLRQTHLKLYLRGCESTGAISAALMTSHCLSRGSQGQFVMEQDGGRKSMIIFRNFEAGVLFRHNENCSMVAAPCCKRMDPSACCGEGAQNSTSVILPVPFCLHGPTYSEGSQYPQHLPYFHDLRGLRIDKSVPKWLTELDRLNQLELEENARRRLVDHASESSLCDRKDVSSLRE